MYDTKCWDLAKAFLEDAGHTDKRVDTDTHIATLAQAIQDTIEDFINYDTRGAT